jgi:hypothetical protein
MGAINFCFSYKKHITADGELREDSVVKDFFTTATDGKNYKTKNYNLDMMDTRL